MKMIKYVKPITIHNSDTIVLMEVYPFLGSSRGAQNPHVVNITVNGTTIKNKEYNSIDLLDSNWMEDLEKEVRREFESMSLTKVTQSIPELLKLRGFIQE